MICQMCFEEEATKGENLCQNCINAINDDEDNETLEELIENID
jgi:hypothetical protein